MDSFPKTLFAILISLHLTIGVPLASAELEELANQSSGSSAQAPAKNRLRSAFADVLSEGEVIFVVGPISPDPIENLAGCDNLTVESYDQAYNFSCNGMEKGFVPNSTLSKALAPYGITVTADGRLRDETNGSYIGNETINNALLDLVHSHEHTQAARQILLQKIGI